MPSLLFDFSFWLGFLYFIFAIFLVFYIPGNILIRNLKLSFWQKTIISFPVGMVLWAWQGFIFGYLGLRWLSYIYIFILFTFFLKINYKNLKNPQKFLNNLKAIKINPDPIITTCIFLGLLFQTSIVWLMGIENKNGLYFCCGAIGDFIYHLGLTNQIINRFPPFEQDMTGVLVTNYHYWGNIVVAELVRVFHLPLTFTEFQYIGLFLSLLFGLSAIVFAQLNNLSKNFTRWLLFFLYFGGDFIFIVILMTRKVFDFSMGPLENGMALLNNPPRAFAVVLFFSGLCLFSVWIKKRNNSIGFLTMLILGSLIGFKVYIGIFALTGISFVAIYFLIKKKLKPLIPIIFLFIISGIVYLPVNKSSGGIHFIGFWRSEEFIVQPALDLSHLELARQIFIQHKNYLHAFIYDLFFTFLFIFSIFGSKLFGIFQTKKSLSKFPIELNIFLISGIIVSLITGLFFWQQSGGSNSFNFLVSVYIILSLYSALAVSYWMEKLKKKLFVFIIILAFLSLNLPRIIYEEFKNINHIKTNWGHNISQNELEAMDYIKKYTPKNAIVLTDYTQYQTFITQRNIFLGDYSLLGSHDVNTSKRQKIQKTILESTDCNKVKNLLYGNNIFYIYIQLTSSLKCNNQNSFLKSIFKNNAIQILKVI